MELVIIVIGLVTRVVGLITEIIKFISTARAERSQELDEDRQRKR